MKLSLMLKIWMEWLGLIGPYRTEKLHIFEKYPFDYILHHVKRHFMSRNTTFSRLRSKHVILLHRYSRVGLLDWCSGVCRHRVSTFGFDCKAVLGEVELCSAMRGEVRKPTLPLACAPCWISLDWRQVKLVVDDGRASQATTEGPSWQESSMQ